MGVKCGKTEITLDLEPDNPGFSPVTPASRVTLCKSLTLWASDSSSLKQGSSLKRHLAKIFVSILNGVYRPIQHSIWDKRTQQTDPWYSLGWIMNLKKKKKNQVSIISGFSFSTSCLHLNTLSLTMSIYSLSQWQRRMAKAQQTEELWKSNHDNHELQRNNSFLKRNILPIY